MLAGHQLAACRRAVRGSPPRSVVADLRRDVGAAHVPGRAVGVLRAAPRHGAGVLDAAEEGVRVGVVDPAVLALVGEELVGQRVDVAVLALPLLTRPGVVDHVEGEAAVPLPLGGVHRVGRGHTDRRGSLSVTAHAVEVAGRAVAFGVPAAVGREDVVDMDGEIVPVLTEVYALGQPFDNAAGKDAELLLVVVVGEGHDEFAASVVRVLADQAAAAASRRARRCRRSW